MDFGAVSTTYGVDFSLPPDDERNSLFKRKSKDHFRIHLGAPVWTTREWVGNFYPEGCPSSQFLHYYSRSFGAIELNSTFYAVPSEKTIQLWRQQTPESFLFCAKVPQDVSHTHASADERVEKVRLFEERMSGLGHRFGMSFLQLPPSFSPGDRGLLKEMTSAFSKKVPVAIEFRHPGWFANRKLRGGLWEWMVENSFASVITDTGGRPEVRHSSLTSDQVVIRFLGNELDRTDFERIDLWLERIRMWKNHGGLEVYFFIHQVRNVRVPELAQYFAQKARKTLSVDFCWEGPEQLNLLS